MYGAIITLLKNVSLLIFHFSILSARTRNQFGPELQGPSQVGEEAVFADDQQSTVQPVLFSQALVPSYITFLPCQLALGINLAWAPGNLSKMTSLISAVSSSLCCCFDIHGNDFQV